MKENELPHKIFKGILLLIAVSLLAMILNQCVIVWRSKETQIDYKGAEPSDLKLEFNLLNKRVDTVRQEQEEIKQILDTL